MELKPLKITGSHPDQKKPNTQTDRVAASIWPRSYEGEGSALGGEQLQKPQDLRGPSLDDSHRVGYSSNSGTTPSQEQAQVKHTAKIGKVKPAKPTPVAHKGAPPKVGTRRSGKSAPCASPRSDAGKHRI